MATTKRILTFAALLLLTAFLTSSCGGGDNDNTPTPSPSGSRVVLYTLTGTYSAPLTIIYTNEDGGRQVVDKVALPWSKEVTVKGIGVVSISLGGGSEAGNYGQPGETLTGKIMVGGIEKKSITATAISTGRIELGGLGHVLGL